MILASIVKILFSIIFIVNVIETNRSVHYLRNKEDIFTITDNNKFKYEQRICTKYIYTIIIRAFAQICINTAYTIKEIMYHGNMINGQVINITLLILNIVAYCGTLSGKHHSQLMHEYLHLKLRKLYWIFTIVQPCWVVIIVIIDMWTCVMH